MSTQTGRSGLGMALTASLFAMGLAGMARGQTSGSSDDNPGTFRAPWNGELLGMGARRPTAEEQAWSDKNMVKTGRVRWNALGLARVNMARQAKGLQRLTGSDAATVDLGREVSEPPTGGSTAAEPAVAVLPAAVDNSTTKYFPPIRSQGSLASCGQFSAVYYTLTHMTAMARNWDAKNGGDAYRFSPKWTYNMLNGGDNTGTHHYDAFYIAIKHGLAVWSDFPYDSDYRGWCMNPDVWLYALSHRAAQSGKVAAVNTDAGLNQLKQLLVNGYVLNFSTYISSWQWKAIQNDPATAADDVYFGRSCAYAVNGTAGGHAMTIVGYSDDIWVDINSNGMVDAGEKGALRIANSWGTGWNEGGYCWLAYQALRTANPAYSSEAIFWYNETSWVTARAAYQPRLVAEFTLNHAKRTQVMMALGASAVTTTTPSTLWSPFGVLSYAGGSWAFDGTSTPRDGTFMLDMTDLVSAAGGSQRYYLRMVDSTLGDISSLLSFRLIDVVNNTEIAPVMAPVYADKSEARVYIDYDASAGAAPPAAVVSVSTTGGNVPLPVTFDGGASSDPDGTVASYAWSFGDGATATGPVVTHTYTRAGTWTATLTVTDNSGATGTKTVTLTVTDPNVVVAPGTLTATAMKGAVALKWTDLSNNESGFAIERSTKVGKVYGAFVQVATVGANVASYTDPVAAGSYQYRVRALNASTGAVSPYSNTASARVR